MPCNIGYKTVSRVRVPAPQPQMLREKTKAPKVDADLLSKIGAADPEFLRWLEGYDFTPVMQEALRRALRAAGNTDGVTFAVTPGGLFLEGGAAYTNSGERQRAEKTIRAVSDRWQIEVLGIVAQLLSYEVSVSVRGSTVVLEGEKQGGVIPQYLRITKAAGENATVVFEHFASRKVLEEEEAKFLGLAQRMGVKILVLNTEASGSPIPQGMTQEEFDRIHGHEHGAGGR